MGSKLYIDGQAGTTALRIRDWLAGRNDLEVVILPEAQRKDPAARRQALENADIALLCLPDDAAKEAAAWLADSPVRILDASTAHRVDPDWVYGLPELSTDQPGRIAAAQRVSNPGCYPTGAILLLRPLIEAGLLPADYPVTVNAVSGYSGGGKSMIEAYEARTAPDFELYGLGLEHKHVAELQLYSGLTRRPIFVPSVGDFRQGMIDCIPLLLDGSMN